MDLKSNTREETINVYKYLIRVPSGSDHLETGRRLEDSITTYLDK
jgi:hypothetical protein